jgi:hypothetical protein
MEPLTCAFRPSGLTLGRPPCSLLPSLGAWYPWYPSSLAVLSAWQVSLDHINQIFLFR